MLFLCAPEKYDTSTSLLTDSKDEHIVLMVDPVRGTWLGKTYLKQYDVSNPTELPIPPVADIVPLVST